MRHQWNPGRHIAGQRQPAAIACPTRNVNERPSPCEGNMECASSAPICGCNVIGANSLAAVPAGVAAGGQLILPIDAGDACKYKARSMLLVGYGAAAGPVGLIATAATRLPFLLVNAQVGSIPQIRRTGQVQFGIISDGYSDNKELTCVDWASFTSTQNQGLTLTFNNIVEATAMHLFVVLWGDTLS